MASLERHRQHFYNWYDTQTLNPLPPRYVSTVDSGNLAGALLTLQPGLLELADKPLLGPQLFAGIAESLAVLSDALVSEQLNEHALLEVQGELDAAQAAAPQSLQATCQRLKKLLEHSQLLRKTLQPAVNSESQYWLQALIAHCSDQHDELSQFCLPLLTTSVQPEQATWRQLTQLDSAQWPLAEQAQVLAVQRCANERIECAKRLAHQAGNLAQMEYGFLYDSNRDLFSIGYNVDETRLNSACYNLLASEARLTSFVAIAQGQLPQVGWFSLGRLLTSNNGVPVLLSWTGSMFEYLMPMLVMPSFSGTLLDQTCRAAVARQIEHGNQLGIPWGVSESGYNTRDAHHNYQYRAFGVPGLGLKRGLGEDIVVAPYASVLALMVTPQAACKNLRLLAEQGLAGHFGLYEAVDFTPARLPRGQSAAVIHSFKAHHQGMSLLALTYLLLDRPMQRRFESDPQFQAIALLLQERIPKTAAQYLHATHSPEVDAAARTTETKLRVYTDPGRRHPAVQLLSNGHYHVMLSSAGGGHYWSPTPLPRPGTGGYTTRHGFGYSVFEHDEDGIHSELWVYVALDASVKFSRLRVHNHSGRNRRLSATGYVAWVLGDLREKLAMHVVTEQDPSSGALFARNAYSIDFPGRMAFFDVDPPARSVSGDRSEFLGRNGNLNAPAAMAKPHLSGRTGGSLDPCAAIQVAFELIDGARQDIIFRLGAGHDAIDAQHLVQRFRGARAASSALDEVRAHWRSTLGAIQIKTPEPAIDVLANGWLMYQVIASRFWARSGYYQSGGAFGFRDQLQDSMIMVHASPTASRQYLLLCAAHQFSEGDVPH
jgi:cyclic beta-1,2-glucan synthetase